MSNNISQKIIIYILNLLKELFNFSLFFQIVKTKIEIGQNKCPKSNRATKIAEKRGS